MISNEEKKDGITLQYKKLYTILREIISKHYSDFHCLNYIHFIRIENELKSHEKVCKNKQICGIAMPSEKNNILEFNQYMQSDTLFMLPLNL